MTKIFVSWGQRGREIIRGTAKKTNSVTIVLSFEFFYTFPTYQKWYAILLNTKFPKFLLAKDASACEEEATLHEIKRNLSTYWNCISLELFWSNNLTTTWQVENMSKSDWMKLWTRFRTQCVTIVQDRRTSPFLGLLHLFLWKVLYLAICSFHI